MHVAGLYVAGTGSFALEVIEYARGSGHEVVGLVELVDSSRIGSQVHGLPVVGLDAEAGTVVLGMGAIVLNGIEVGAQALVAAGAVVVRPVEPATRVQGVPARVFVPA